MKIYYVICEDCSVRSWTEDMSNRGQFNVTRNEVEFGKLIHAIEQYGVVFQEAREDTSTD